MNLLVFVKKKWQVNILVVHSVMILFKTFFWEKWKSDFLQKYIHAILFSYLFSSFGLEVIFWNWPNLLFLLSLGNFWHLWKRCNLRCSPKKSFREVVLCKMWNQPINLQNFFILEFGSKKIHPRLDLVNLDLVNYSI